MERCEDDVETLQGPIGEVETAVGHDIHLAAVEDGYLPIALTQCCDLVRLSGDVTDLKGPRRARPLRVVRDGDVLVAESNRALNHRLDGVPAIAPGRVHVEIAANVGGFDKGRQFVPRGGDERIGSFPYLWRDERQVEGGVDVGLRGGNFVEAVSSRQSIRGERPASPGCKRAQPFEMG